MKASLIRCATVSLIMSVTLACAQNADSIVQTPALPDSPDGTVLAVAEALRNNHAEFLWTALPESYRADIVEITHTFAEKMDPTVYDRAFALVMRAIEVLDDRKDIILASETFKSSGTDAEEVRTSLSNSQLFVSTLKSSEIATLSGLGSVDWESFLASTASKLLESAAAMETENGVNPLDDLDSLKVETLDVTDDRATLRISSENHEPEEVQMARVEGRWVPAEMADEWPQFVEDARKGLAEMTPENMAAQKTQMMMFLGMADGLIDQIASLQTPEEFDAAIGSMFAPFMGAATTEVEDDETPEPTGDAPEDE